MSFNIWRSACTSYGGRTVLKSKNHGNTCGKGTSDPLPRKAKKWITFGQMKQSMRQMKRFVGVRKVPHHSKHRSSISNGFGFGLFFLGGGVLKSTQAHHEAKKDIF